MHRYAIAHAVLAHLTSTVDCRLLFATHYHALTREFGADPRVRLAHMGALVQPGEGRPDAAPTITFLYTLVAGACPRSYGLEVRCLSACPSWQAAVSVVPASVRYKGCCAHRSTARLEAWCEPGGEPGRHPRVCGDGCDPCWQPHRAQAAGGVTVASVG